MHAPESNTNSDSASADAPARRAWILPAIVTAQFAGTCVWFAGNAVADNLRLELGLDSGAASRLISAIQLGFICGTLLFAVINLADRISPRFLFLICCLLAGTTNGGVVAMSDTGFSTILLLRFCTGVALAGIYPVGMKIAASWYPHGLGNALGLLVGALVAGAGLPYLLQAMGTTVEWPTVMLATSAFAAGGGLLLFLLVDDGPHLPKSAPFQPRAIAQSFRTPAFRSAAFGYFGHMWELYAFWALVPAWLAAAVASHETTIDIAGWTAATFGAGALGCAAGGWLSKRIGSARVAATCLALSAVCCLVSPLVFTSASLPITLVFIVIWGCAVVGDSPQFSALTATSAPRDYVGSAVTIVTSIGFAITIPAIQVVSSLHAAGSTRWAYLALAPGPILGLWWLRTSLRNKT